MLNNVETITVEPDDEYFIAVCQQKIHSFLMLGVVPAVGGEPRLLARVGKHKFKLHYAAVDAALLDERISKKKEDPTKINYKAYQIDAKKVYNCIRLINTIESQQLKNPRVNKHLRKMAAPSVGSDGEIHRKTQYISAYMPTNSSEGDANRKINYSFNILNTQNIEQISDDQSVDNIAQHAQFLSFYNTCRTTALEMAEWVLQFKTNISQFFFITPRYHTTLRYGAPEGKTFYILPAPPTAYTEHLNSKQASVAAQLYQQLENIPTQKLQDPLTREKFKALKSTYLDIVGENNLALNALLEKINQHETTQSNKLFARRAPCCLSQIACKFFDRPVTTKRLFDSIKTDLQREIKSVNSCA